jgi:hypothetical protein
MLLRFLYGACWIAGAALAVALTVVWAALVGAPKEAQLQVPSRIGRAGAAADLDLNRIRETVRDLSAAPSRLTGYGAQAAGEHLLGELKKLGLKDLEVQDFDVTVPLVRSAILEAATADGPVRLSLHPLWPNLARTCQTGPAGLTGPLVDLGRGKDADLAGKKILGAIAVMDWNSDAEWLGVPEFGGKAVLFRANPLATGTSARRKFLSVPADIPRFYVAREDAAALDKLLAAGLGAVTIKCEMDWESAPARNILVRVCPGQAAPDPSDTDRAPLIVHAYYDSISVVPTLSPGAEQACGAAVLLELARFLSALEQKPERPIYLLFTGGHGQALAGMTHFVRRLHDGLADGWKKDPGALLARIGKPGLVVGLDLSSHSERLGLFCQGHFRDEYEDRLRPRFRDFGLKITEYLTSFSSREDPKQKEAEALASFVDCINLTQGRGWWTYFPYRGAFESELAAQAGYPAVTLATVDDNRRALDTPDDRCEALDFGLLGKQVLAAPGRRAGLANLILAFAFWKGPFVSAALTDYLGRLQGRVVWLDQNRDFTPNQPLDGATVFLKLRRRDKQLVGTRGIPVTRTNAEGRFTFDGLIQFPARWEFKNCTLEAYGTATERFIQANPRACHEFVVTTRAGISGTDPTSGLSPNFRIERDGALLYAPDMARANEYPWIAPITGAEQSRNLVCFPCRAISFFGLTDPRGYLPITDVQVLNAATQSPPFQFGQSTADEPTSETDENCCTVWADPSLRVRVTMGLGFREKRLVLLNNSLANPVGEGFALNALDQIPSMVLQGAGDMWRLDQSRFEKLEKHGVNNPRVKAIREETAGHLEEARQALAARDYRTYRAASEKGWALENRSYTELLAMTNNMIHGVLFYLALLLPFSYCLERLLFASGTIRRRISWMVAIFAASFAVLALIHPAFRFTMTPLIVLLAFIILALAVTVGLLIAGRFDTLLREQKQAASGVHEEAANTGGIAVRAVDLGIANIRRRPQRGFLTALTIVLVTFTLLSFTSIVPAVSISKLPHRDGWPAYKGLLARDRRWNALPEPLYLSLKRTLGGSSGDSMDVHALPGTRSTVAGRAWFFSDASGQLSQIDLGASSGDSMDVHALPGTHAAAAPTRRFTAVSLLCLEHTEPAVTGLDRTLIAGRWFRSEDELSIILPEHAATELGYGPADVGKDVVLFGQKIPLAGIVDGKQLDAFRDLDGEPITPVDFVRQEQQQAQRAAAEQTDTLEKYEHHAGAGLAILPLRFGMRLGARLRSIAVRTGAGVDPEAEAEGYVRRSNQTILACDGQRTTLLAALDTSSVSLTGQIAIPLLLGFIMVLSTMLGSVYERRREIFVYNSVGLSPGNVASLFLAESSVYAILGASLGYLLGQVVSKILLVTGALSGLTLNYSAGTTVFVTLVSMFIVVASTIYPARQAFYAAIPESRRKGAAGADQFATDTVALYLPFVATPSAVLGLQAYMHEYLDGLQGITVGDLAVEDLAPGTGTGDDGRSVPVLAFRAWLAPFDLGISHDVQLRIVYRAERGVYQYHLTATRFSGDQQNWRRLTPRFIQALRKQLLMWRVLPVTSHQAYIEKGQRLFAQAGGRDA